MLTGGAASKMGGLSPPHGSASVPVPNWGHLKLSVIPSLSTVRSPFTTTVIYTLLNCGPFETQGHSCVDKLGSIQTQTVMETLSNWDPLDKLLCTLCQTGIHLDTNVIDKLQNWGQFGPQMLC